MSTYIHTADMETRQTIRQLIHDGAARLESAGIRDRVQRLAREHLDDAIATLDTVELVASAKVELVELANFIWQRNS